MASSKCNAAELEMYFAYFYCGIIPKLYDMRSHEFMRTVRVSLKDIRQQGQDTDKKVRKYVLGHVQFQKPEDISRRMLLNAPRYKCAYLYAYSLLHTAIVHHHFTNYVNNNRNAVLNYFNEKKLNICCLGGGPGTEAVAICKVINDLFLEIINSEQFPSLEIYVSVIDICENWEPELLSIVAAVNEYRSIFDSKKVKICAKFIQANLLEPFDQKVQDEIKNANIVTMFKLASGIKERTPNTDNNEIQQMMMRVLDGMEKDSCLLCLDYASGDVIRRLMKFLSKCSYSVFETMEHEKHTLNILALKKMEKIIHLNFRRNTPVHVWIPTRITTVSSYFCIKGQNEEKLDSVTSATNSMSCQFKPSNFQITKCTPAKKLNEKGSKSSSGITKDEINIKPSKKKSCNKNNAGFSANTSDQIDIIPPKQKSSK